MPDPAADPLLAPREPLANGDAPKRPRSWKRIIAWIGLWGFAWLLLIAILLPSLGRAREAANRVKCSSNLAQLGRAMFLYAGENGGQLPPDWSTLVVTQELVPYTVTCPSADREPATGATTQAVVDAMRSGNHYGYAWAGGALHARDLTADTVLAFDVDLHVPRDYSVRTRGINVLLGDGSVTFVDEPTAKAIHAQFIAGVRPVMLPRPDVRATTTSSTP